MIHPQQTKQVFVTRRGTFKFKVLSFGLSNAPAIFQRLMDLVLAGLTWEICCCLLLFIRLMNQKTWQNAGFNTREQNTAQ